jgi:putative hydrolase of the HAD superfamily
LTERPVEAVIFDYGGVISVSVFQDLDPMEDELGVPRGSVHRLMFGTVDEIEPDYHLLETGQLSVTEYIEGLVRRAPQVLGKPLDADAYMRFAAARPLQVQWPVVHRIRELHVGGMRLALLTNNVKEFGDAWRASFPVDDLFSVVVDSSEVGMRKPDPRIYELTCERIGTETAATIFLDDNLENIAAATDLGIETVLVTPDPLETVAALDAVLDRRGTHLFGH